MATGPGPQLGPARAAIAAGGLLTAWAFGERTPWAPVAAALRRRFAHLNLTRDQVFQIHQAWDQALFTGQRMRRMTTGVLGHYDHLWHPGIGDNYGYQYTFTLTDPATGRQVTRRGMVLSDTPLSANDVRTQAAQVVADLIGEERHSLPGAAAGDIAVPRIRIEAAYRR